MSNRCELCGREPVETTVHHLTPKEMGGTFMPTADLCIPCHKQIHSLFTNQDLMRLHLTELQALRENERMALLFAGFANSHLPPFPGHANPITFADPNSNDTS